MCKICILAALQKNNGPAQLAAADQRHAAPSQGRCCLRKSLTALHCAGHFSGCAVRLWSRISSHTVALHKRGECMIIQVSAGCLSHELSKIWESAWPDAHERNSLTWPQSTQKKPRCSCRHCSAVIYWSWQPSGSSPSPTPLSLK